MIASALLLQLQVAGSIVVAGRVARIADGDTVAAAGARVVLHRVGNTVQGPLDSMIAAGDGGFRFQVMADSGDVLLVSGRWAGVEYFAPPVIPGVSILVIVADTASDVPIRTAARHVIIGGPAADGARDVVDLVVLRNADVRTGVGRDSLTPTWSMALPPLVANLALGDADFAEDAFDVHDDTLHLFAPVPPGDRQFFLQYQLAPGAIALDLPLDTGTDTLTILAEEGDLDLSSGMVHQGFEEMQGRRFTRWSGAGSLGHVRVGFGGSRSLPGWLLPLLIAVLALPLIWGTRKALSRT